METTITKNKSALIDEPILTGLPEELQVTVYKDEHGITVFVDNHLVYQLSYSDKEGLRHWVRKFNDFLGMHSQIYAINDLFNSEVSNE